MDKLVKAFLGDGSKKWLLIHIEIQGDREIDFPQRVFQQIADLEALRKIRAGPKQAQSVAEAEALIHAHIKAES